MAAKPGIQSMMHDAVVAGLLPKQPLKIAFPLSLKQPPPPTSKPSMAKTKLLPSSMFKKRPWQQTRHGSKQLTGITGPSLRTRQCQNSNIPVRPLKMTTVMIWIFLLSLGRADSVHRSTKRIFHRCLTGVD